MATPSTPSFLKPQETEAAIKPPDDASKKPDKRVSRWVLLSAFGTLFIAVAIVCLLFLRHRAKAQSGKIAFGSSASANSKSVHLPPPTPTVELPLDPFVVNLADAGGHSYARIGLTLSLTASQDASGKSEEKAGAAGDVASSRDMVRDTIITVLNQEQSTDLLAPDGKEHLKQAIRAAVAARNPQLKIANIYFTEFLIQQ
jgi:flagellar FliL protein